MPVEEYVPATKKFVDNYKNLSSPGPVPKHCLGFIYIRSEDYDLDLNFDETKLKNKSDHASNYKVKLFHKNTVVIDG